VTALISTIPRARCCIAIAKDERLERSTENQAPQAGNAQQAAAVKMGFLRQASLRARSLVSPANVLLSAQEEDRGIWEGPFWFTRPANRFVSARGVPTSLSTAAAVLSVAARLPSCLIAVLPSDFWVARESVLREAIDRAFKSIEMIPDCIVTLGMIDTHPEIDEDYLVVGPNNNQKGAVILARVNRPESRAAQQLINEGAMVASGILLGYAHAFAARIRKYWPHLARELTHTLESDCRPEGENRLSGQAYRHVPRSIINSIRLSSPTFPMRAFRVQGSGWCSRKPIKEIRPESASDRRAGTFGPNLFTSDYPS
jgi:mannose-1-phosphate guanylyltransferase